MAAAPNESGPARFSCRAASLYLAKVTFEPAATVPV